MVPLLKACWLWEVNFNIKVQYCSFFDCSCGHSVGWHVPFNNSIGTIIIYDGMSTCLELLIQSTQSNSSGLAEFAALVVYNCVAIL